MNRSTLLAAAALALAPVAADGAEAVPSPAALLAGPCFNCHGPEGRSPGAIPTIRGRPAEVLLQALKEFKAGTKEATVMGRLSKGYSDEQLQLLAEYFAGPGEKRGKTP